MVDIYSVDWNVGAHISFSQKIYKTVQNALDCGMYSVQFFMGSPQTCKRQKIEEEDIQKTLRIIKRYPMNIFSHFPYISNLAGKSCKDGLAWNGNSSVDSYLRIIIKELEYELSILDKLNGGVVIHPGSYPNRADGLCSISKSINKINFQDNYLLLLENCAGEGNKLCKNFYELKTVLDGINIDKKKNVAVCVDTAHIWGEGDYDLSKVEEIERMFNEFDEIIGLKYFKLLHLNDSEVELGAKKDRHACLGVGHIWKNSFDSLLFLLNKCKKLKIPMILETNGNDMITLSKLSNLESYSCKPCGTIKRKPKIENCTDC
tara:strand:- start:3661 stop:4614 length:954 start_codon:yes stop_codon:yes gene_type:complete